jgi:hypothetical protein
MIYDLANILQNVLYSGRLLVIIQVFFDFSENLVQADFFVM